MNVIRCLMLSLAVMLALGGPLFGEEPPYTATIGEDGTQKVEILGGEYFFRPNHLIVKVNVPVTMKFRKEASIVPHNLIVKASDAGIDIDVSLDTDWQTLTFTPTKVGRYEMNCDKRLLWFKSHKKKGMHGIIEVVP